jgi:uncharacterized repeat protein (TIGR01451 family)
MKSLKANGTQSTNLNIPMNIMTARRLIRIGAGLVLVALVAGIFYSGSSASSLHWGFGAAPGNESTKEVSRTAGSKRGEISGIQNFLHLPIGVGSWKSAMADPTDGAGVPPVFTVVDQTVPIATYADNCTTAQTVFSLGETVCAKAVGVNPALGRRFAWTDPAGFIRTFTPITTDPQTDSYPLPTDSTTIIGNFVVDNRGTWKASVVSSRGSLLFTAPFIVKGPTPTANLSVAKGISNSSVNAGDPVTFIVSVTNSGPSDATNVVLTDPTPLNAAFSSVTPSGGFTCPGNVLPCTAATLAAGATASFEIVYTAGSAGNTITNVATVSSPDAVGATPSYVDPDSTDDSAAAVVRIGSGDGTPTGCVIECPNSIVVTANTTQDLDGPGGNPPVSGAFVDYAPEGFGTCGAVTSLPISHSFFHVGVTQVTTTSATGGGSCSFTVTVIDTPPPAITCAGDQTVVAGAGQSDAAVVVNTPTAVSGTNVTVSGSRSDNGQLDDPYPIGTTTITWTATECLDSPQCVDPFARTAFCTQRIIVTSVDAPTISCPSDKTFNAGGGCQALVTLPEIGTPTTGGLNVVLTSDRSDHLPLGSPYPAGQTVITWTATNNLGSASCSQTISVTNTGNGSTPPTLTVPADLNVTTDSCSALLDDELGVATATDVCASSVSITRTGVPTIPCPIPGNPNRVCETFVFPTGTTDVTYTATNSAGLTATGVQHVTVTESPSIPPTFTFVPGNVGPFNTGPTATSCGTFVGDATLGMATATDNCVVTVTRTGVPAGNIFPVGDTDITYTAADNSGNSITAHQHVTVVDDTPPTVTPPAAVTLHTGAGATSCGVTVTDLDGTLGIGSATDNCTGVGAVTRSGVPPGNNFPVGPTTLTYSATDAHGNTSSATQLVTVVDDTPPTVTAPGAVTLYTGAGATSCSVTVSNLDATLGTGSATDNCPGVSAVTRSGVPAGNVFPAGPTTLTYSATDAHGNTSSATQIVTVVDNTPPVITLNGQTPSMWPPNHKYQTFGVTDFVTAVNDNCDGPISVSSVVITKVTSDELENSGGDGNTLNDIVIAANCKSVQLRSERDGGGNGRVYTIFFKAVDSHGNVGTATARVVVQHNPGQTAVDSGVHYTVVSSCP